MTIEHARRPEQGARWSEDEVADGRLLIVRPPEGMLDRGTTWECLNNSERVKHTRERSIADDAASGLIGRKEKTRREIAHERDRKGGC